MTSREEEGNIRTALELLNMDVLLLHALMSKAPQNVNTDMQLAALFHTGTIRALE